MQPRAFPAKIEHVRIPPIKCQGIKSKLVDFIASNIKWSGEGTWYEPFMGSGVVTFNAAPSRAVLSDINPHLVNFYQDIQSRRIIPDGVKAFLELHGKKLAESGTSKDSHYYEMRDKFNATHDPLYLLFLNRSCFNGLIRFNASGEFNTPFGRKPHRFTKAYITKIVNQVRWVQDLITAREYQFKCCTWKEALAGATGRDFAYIDPPYYGRHATYFDEWREQDALELVNWTKTAPAGYAISLWYKNKHRENTFIKEHWPDAVIRTNEHYYFLGPKEELRTSMIEALIIKPGYAAENVVPVVAYFKGYHD